MFEFEKGSVKAESLFFNWVSNIVKIVVYYLGMGSENELSALLVDKNYCHEIINLACL